jgi:hypothetical protein
MTVIYITDRLLRTTAELLASFADPYEKEGVVYWFGLELGDRAVVTSLIVPDADTSNGEVVTSAAANAEALTTVVNTPLILLGQAHSHPRGFVGHSRVDDRQTFAQFPGAISVVVPFYGRRGMALDCCGVHRHIDGKYRRIQPVRVAEHIRVLPGLADFRESYSVPFGSSANEGNDDQ